MSIPTDSISRISPEEQAGLNRLGQAKERGEKLLERTTGTAIPNFNAWGNSGARQAVFTQSQIACDNASGGNSTKAMLCTAGSMLTQDTRMVTDLFAKAEDAQKDIDHLNSQRGEASADKTFIDQRIQDLTKQRDDKLKNAFAGAADIEQRVTKLQADKQAANISDKDLNEMKVEGAAGPSTSDLQAMREAVERARPQQASNLKGSTEEVKKEAEKVGKERWNKMTGEMTVLQRRLQNDEQLRKTRAV